MNSPALVDISAAADHLGITERHLRELVYRRAIPYVKVGRLVRFEPADLAEYRARQRVPAAERAS